MENQGRLEGGLCVGWSFLCWMFRHILRPCPHCYLCTHTQPSQADPEAALGGLGHSLLPQRSPLDALPLRTGSHVTGMHAGCGELPPHRDTQCPTVSVPGNPVRQKPAQRVLGDHIHSQWGRRLGENSPKASSTSGVKLGLPAPAAAPVPGCG